MEPLNDDDYTLKPLINLKITNKFSKKIQFFFRSLLLQRHICTNIPELNVLEEFPNAIQAIKYLNQNDIENILIKLRDDLVEFSLVICPGISHPIRPFCEQLSKMKKLRSFTLHNHIGWFPSEETHMIFK